MDSEQEVLGRGEQEVDMNWIHQREKKYPRNRHHYKTGKRQNYANMRRWGGGRCGRGSAQGKTEAFTTRSLTVHPDCECQPSYRPSVTFLKMEMAQ